MSNAAILLTGGAGYIGSHVVRQVGEAGERVVILDNLKPRIRTLATGTRRRTQMQRTASV